MNIVKRNGDSVPYDVEKIHKVVNWAVEDIKGVTASDIEINSKLQMKDGITADEIHNVLIESAVNLISKRAKLSIRCFSIIILSVT